MRYRIKTYNINVNKNIVTIEFPVPDGIVIHIDPNDGSLNSSDEIFIKESIRLIIDETKKIVLCSSMQKDSIININARGKQGESTADSIYINIAIPDGKTITSSDQFTIEIDWGDTINDNIPTDYAKVGEYDTQLSNIETSVATLTALDPDIKAGKKELALQITRKGRNVNENDTLLQMASQVRGISQNPVVFEGSAEYEKQMFGTTTTTTTPYQQDGPLWNLYKVMTDLLNDGRFTEYGGILLAEYYKGPDTIELMNAGAGGAYFTSDLQLYTEDKTGENAHVWNDVYNGMANRWVAYLFSAPSTNYTIPSTTLCPHSIHIGRHVGTISCSFAGKISEIVVSDLVDDTGTQLNVLDATDFSSKQTWNSKVIIRNTNGFAGTDAFYTPSFTYLNYPIKVLNSGNIIGLGSSTLNTIELPNLEIINGGYIFNTRSSRSNNSVVNILMPKLREINTEDRIYDTYDTSNVPNLRLWYMPLLEKCLSSNVGGVIGGRNVIDVWVGPMKTNLYMRGWNSSLITSESDIAKLNANIRDHIAARVSDRTGKTALTFTVSTTLYDKLEQNTIEAFTAKNWNVAGA